MVLTPSQDGGILFAKKIIPLDTAGKEEKKVTTVILGVSNTDHNEKEKYGRLSCTRAID